MDNDLLRRSGQRRRRRRSASRQPFLRIPVSHQVRVDHHRRRLQCQRTRVGRESRGIPTKLCPRPHRFGESTGGGCESARNSPSILRDGEARLVTLQEESRRAPPPVTPVHFATELATGVASRERRVESRIVCRRRPKRVGPRKPGLWQLLRQT